MVVKSGPDFPEEEEPALEEKKKIAPPQPKPVAVAATADKEEQKSTTTAKTEESIWTKDNIKKGPSDQYPFLSVFPGPWKRKTNQKIEW